MTAPLSAMPDAVVRTVVADDGTEIATYDFGGQGDDLLLVHATGFCAGVFAPLAAALVPAFHCVAIDLRFHGRSGRPPGGDHHWNGFALDVLAAIDGLGLHHPVGFGHSCGGAAVLLAEERRPGTFSAIYAFEPVVFPGYDPELAPRGGPNLAEASRRRRETFPSPDDAFANFASKPPLDALDLDALRGYVECGFETIPEGEPGADGVAVRLRCEREDEASVFENGMTHDAFALLSEVRCPITMACGARPGAFGPGIHPAYAERLRDGRYEVFEDLGHFGPLEDPAAVGRAIAAAYGPGARPEGAGA